jgi:uncharacterized protein (DUF1330 family)
MLSAVTRHDGVLVVGSNTTVVEGTGRTMNAIIRFPSKEAALGLYNTPVPIPVSRRPNPVVRDGSQALLPPAD